MLKKQVDNNQYTKSGWHISRWTLKSQQTSQTESWKDNCLLTEAKPKQKENQKPKKTQKTKKTKTRIQSHKNTISKSPQNLLDILKNEKSVSLYSRKKKQLIENNSKLAQEFDLTKTSKKLL